MGGVPEKDEIKDPTIGSFGISTSLGPLKGGGDAESRAGVPAAAISVLCHARGIDSRGCLVRRRANESIIVERMEERKMPMKLVV
jgi:hypothetical protein